jgi:hypothetical protein
MMTTRRERIPTYLLSLFYYGMTYWLLRRTDQHESVFAMFTGAMLVLVVVTAITFRWKISVHMAGIGGLVGALTGLFALHGSFSIGVIAAAIIATGLLGSARLADSDHSPAQLGAGRLPGLRDRVLLRVRIVPRVSRRIAIVLLCMAAGAGVRAQPQVKHFWAGALGPHSIKVNVQLDGPSNSLRVLVSEDTLFLAPIASTYVQTDSIARYMVPVEVTGLGAGTTYHYRFEVEDVVDDSPAHSGSFHTPKEAPASFSFAVGSCNESSAHPVWQSMLDHKPLFLLSTGDLHYGDPSDTTLEDHQTDLEDLVLGVEPAATFLHHVPIVYMWDDHDLAGDGATAESPGRYAAFRVYRQYVPHHPLACPQDTMPIYQAFTIGRLRFIVSDMRSTPRPRST